MWICTDRSPGRSTRGAMMDVLVVLVEVVEDVVVVDVVVGNPGSTNTSSGPPPTRAWCRISTGRLSSIVGTIASICPPQTNGQSDGGVPGGGFAQKSAQRAIGSRTPSCSSQTSAGQNCGPCR